MGLSLRRQSFTAGSEPITSVFSQRATWSGSRMVLSSTSLSTAAPTPKKAANRNASSTFSQVIGKHRLQTRAAPHRPRGWSCSGSWR